MIARLTLRNLIAHKVRLALTALAVVLGVAFVTGTLMFSDTINKSFDEIFEDSRAGTDTVVRAESEFSSGGGDTAAQPIPRELVDRLEGVRGAEKVHGSASGYAAIVGEDGEVVGGQGPPQLGFEWTGDPDFATSELSEGQPPRAPNQVALDTSTAEKAGVGVGDQAKVLLAGPSQTMTVTGLFELTSGTGGSTMAAFEPATAQQLLVEPDHYSEIYLHAEDGVSQETLAEQAGATLPNGFEAVTGDAAAEEDQAEIGEILDFLNIFLLVFAAVAMFVGSFIIFNTFSMLVAQRTRELALVRAVGADRGQVTRAVLGEAIGVGIFGSTVGLALGAGLATGLRAATSAFGVELPTTPLVLSPTTILWGYVIGIVVTLIAAYIPARRAGRIPPVAAMRDDVSLPAKSLRVRVIAGVAVAAIGAAFLVGGLSASGQSAAILVGVGVAGVFIGITMLSPVIGRPATRLIGWPFARLFGPTGRISRANAQRNPRRTAATASALMIGLALVATVSVLAQSMKASVDEAFEEELGPDYVVSSSSFMPFSPEAASAVSGAAGVDEALTFQFGQLRLDGQMTGAGVGDIERLVRPLNLEIEEGSAKLGEDELLASRSMADRQGWQLGSTVPGEYPDGESAQFRIAGIYGDTQTAGALFMGKQSYNAHYPSQLVSQIMVLLEPGVDKAQGRQAIESSIGGWPNLQVQDQNDVKEQARSQVDQLLAMVTVLLLLSIIIAALGIVNTLALSVIERTREIGLLRAVGMSRRQLRRMVRYESIVIAVFGGLLGVGVGLGFGWALQQALADQGIGVFSIPVGQLLGYVAAAGVIGVLAAVWPAWRASRLDVLRAISFE